MANFNDLTNKTFNQLTCISYLGNRKWLCECSCGNTSEVLGYNLTSGHTKSCGCLHQKATTKHGMSDTPTYKTWEMMIQRCTNPNFDKYKYYGGRGIEITQNWRNFVDFYRDMGEIPENMTLERIDVNKGYFKENCVWAGGTEQAYNKRNFNKNSGFTGVYYHKASCKWTAQIGFENNSIHLGLFETKDGAIAARRNAEMFYYGKTKQEDLEAIS